MNRSDSQTRLMIMVQMHRIVKKREWKKRPVAYIKPYKAISDISLEKLATLNEEDVGKVLLDWLRKELERPEFKVAVAKLADLLRTLKAP